MPRGDTLLLRCVSVLAVESLPSGHFLTFQRVAHWSMPAACSGVLICWIFLGWVLIQVLSDVGEGRGAVEELNKTRGGV